MSRHNSMIVTSLMALTLLLAVSACSFPMLPSTSSAPDISATPASPTARPSFQLKVSVIARGLEAPWGLAFLPDGRALVSERDSGKLLRVSPTGRIEEAQRIAANGSGEGGFLGIALSPRYANDGLVYAYLSTEQDNRLVRFRLGEPPTPILTGIPVSGNHNGGRIAFGPDGLLYIGTGDAANRATAQDINSLGGKILRVTPDGKVPADNPFPNKPVYSYGHRNVQGLAWDASGQLYATEFGQNAFDEVNRIVTGGNYGWPEVEGVGKNGRYIDPITTFRTAEASPSGAVLLHNGAIPPWEGNLFVAGLRGERLWRLTLDAHGAVTQRESLLQGQFGRLRHVAQAPDGSLWVLTSNRDGRGNPTSDDDRILRLSS